MDTEVPSSSWMDPIKEYIQGNVPVDQIEEKKFGWKASQYVLNDGKLYNWGFSLPLLRCLDLDEVTYVMRDVHEGVRGNHLAARSLVAKIVWQGYFWPTLNEDVKQFVKVRDQC